MPSSTLFILFGTTSGIGEALHDEAICSKNSECLVINRRAIQPKKHTSTITFDLATTAKSVFFEKLFVWLDKVNQYKRVVLIGNAAEIFPIGPVGELDEVEITTIVQTNFTNYVLILNEFIKRTKELSAIEKRIILISSGAAVAPQDGLALYCSTKAALEMLCQSIFLEQQRLKQVQIIAVRPGAVETAMQEKIRQSSPGKFPKVERYRELKTGGQLADPGWVARQIFVILEKPFWERPIIELDY